MKVLLVRLSSMGDLIHTLPAISDLAAHRPDIQLDWLCEAAFSDIARLHPFVQNVYEMKWRYWRKHLFQAASWREIGCLKHTMQQVGYTHILDSQGLIKSAIFAKMANAPIMGLDKHSAREPLAALFYQQRIAVKKGEDAVWRNRQLFARAFGYDVEGEPDFGVRFSGSLNFLPSSDYHVALHATSRDSKLWPQDNWLLLLKKIHEIDNLPIFLTWGSESERLRAEQIAQVLSFVLVCPKLSLREAAILLGRAQSVVGVDTGLLHLANACNRPLVGIYTDSDPIKTGVQPSDWAVNLGGIGQNPNVDDVFGAHQRVVQAFFER